MGHWEDRSWSHSCFHLFVFGAVDSLYRGQGAIWKFPIYCTLKDNYNTFLSKCCLWSGTLAVSLEPVSVLSKTSLLWDGVACDMASGSDGHVPSSTLPDQILYCVGFHACEPGIWSASRQWCWLWLCGQERRTKAWNRYLSLWGKTADPSKGRGSI